MSRALHKLAAALVAILSALGAASAAVLPAGQPLTVELVRELLEAALPAPEAGERWSITLLAPAFPIGNQAASDAHMVVETVELPPAGGELRALLRVTLPSGETGRIHLRGRAEPAIDVVVPRRALPAGAVIRGEDLAQTTLPRRRLPEGAVTTEAQLIGRAAVRRLAAGRPIRELDLRGPRLVAKGDPVRVLFQRAGLELILEASALEDGAAGDLVRMINPKGGRELRGSVVGPRAVRIGTSEGAR